MNIEASPNVKRIEQYQSRDKDVVDYQLFDLDTIEYMLRGPKPASMKKKSYYSLLGAGQTFGVLVRRPYVHILNDAVGLPSLNLAVGGASPNTFLLNKDYLSRVNNSAFCIVQIVSARGSSNSYFESRHGKNMLRPRGTNLPYVPGDTAYKLLMENEPEAVVRAVVGEVRANWIKENITLLSKIKVPKILLWFSKRSPEYRDNYESYSKLAGVFPQFVNRQMVDEIREFADDYVELVSSRGMPHQLTSLATGAPIDVVLGDKRLIKKENTYYPSPEMHEDAAEALLETVRKYKRV